MFRVERPSNQDPALPDGRSRRFGFRHRRSPTQFRCRTPRPNATEDRPKWPGDLADVGSTSYVERQNLTMRMSMRRFTRLTNGFSKKAENHLHSVAIRFMHYNFVRIHQSLRITPAMAAGVTSKLWSLTDMVRVIDNWEATRTAKPGDRLLG